MHRDDRVGLAHYDAQGVESVTAQIEIAAFLFALVFEGLDEEQLRRPVVFPFLEPPEHDVAWVARLTAHEGEHHLLDITSVLSRVDATH